MITVFLSVVNLGLRMSGIACLIVAAGRGKRIGGSVPKQYMTFRGKSLITHSVDVFKLHPLVERSFGRH